MQLLLALNQDSTRSTLRRSKDTRGVRPGTTSALSVRRGLAFLKKHFNLPFPVDTALLKRGKGGKARPVIQGEAVSALVVSRLERAATSHPSRTVRSACATCTAMCYGCIRLDQINRTQIIAEEVVQGCLFAYTDREKDPDIHRATAKPLWIPVFGIHGDSWSKELLRYTRPVQLGGFLFRDDDSKNGSPFQASKLCNRPKRLQRARFAVREILHHIGGIPRRELGRFDISSFRKFLPHVAERVRMPELDRIEVGRWSGSDAKRLDHLLPAERVAGTFSARHAALPRVHYETESRVDRITGIMCSLVNHVRDTVRQRGEQNLPIRGGWDLLGPLQTSHSEHATDRHETDDDASLSNSSHDSK